MTGVMSRYVVTIGAIFLIICGLIPKVVAIIRTVPIEVLGSGVIVMLGMVVTAGNLDAVGRDVEPPEHGDLCDRTVRRSWSAAGAKSGSVPVRHAAHFDDIWSAASCCDRHRAEPGLARRTV